MTDSPTTILTSASTQTSSYVSTSPPKRKRRPAGTPDPDAEVVALSPKTLMESDKYVCEICNQGFQRDQNLQMHRRRHKVPWKLLKRVDPEVRKRVYVCPESSCLHHSPCHALGDLVGIKKHYRRKHSSMKQWECDKCSKAYAVQSDYKAHLKTCGTRGHCCDCGRVFSRVESFIEHQDTCTAASNKKGVASISDQQAASLPSLGAATPDHHHAPLMPTSPSSAADETKVIKKDTFHHSVFMTSPHKPLANKQGCGASALPQLPYTESAASQAMLGPVVSNAHTCLPLPIASPSSATPSFLLPKVLPRQAPPSAASPPDAPGFARVSWEAQTPSDGPNSLRIHHNAELQLLPTKPYSSQLESSQSSNFYTWGKDITSTNSTTSATLCSSPCEKITDHEKQALNITSALPSAAPCKLQLSIGLLQEDHDWACNEDHRTSLPVSRAHYHEASDAELQLDSKITSMPAWLSWSAFPAGRRQKHCDTLSTKQCSPYTPTDQKQGTFIGHGKHAIRLELATSATPGPWCGTDNFHDTSSLETQEKQDYDYVSCKKASASRDVAVGYGDPANNVRSQSVDIDENLLLGSRKSPSAKLLDCNFSRGTSVAVIEGAAHQQLQKEAQPNLSSGQIAERGQAHNQCSYFLLEAECVRPQLALAERAAELRLQRAREKLKRASDEKLEAEKAWKEARREREQAEAELAGVDYSRVEIASQVAQHDDEVVDTRKPTHKSSSASSSLIPASASAISSSSCQVSTSANSLQMPLNAGGVIINSAPSFITCPSCLQTQILYHPANQLRGTLFLPSQELPSPPPSRHY